MSGRGLIIAGTSSHCGKTTIALGLARALSDRGISVKCAKSGPDYIDPGYLAAASGKPCFNLDGWSMSGARLQSLADHDDFLLVEGAMGLFDGAPPDGRGSVAELARRLSLPVVLVIDCSSMGQSVAAIAHGFISQAKDFKIAGLVLNRVGSDRHARILHNALEGLNIPILGTLARNPRVSRPSRHLGLVQASEATDISGFLEASAQHVSSNLDLDRIQSCAEPLQPTAQTPAALPVLGQRVAVAQDAAFSFVYPHLLADWQSMGVEVTNFSPLADEAPSPDADAIYLPGGYPELFAKSLTRAGNFRSSMKAAATKGVTIYGECGGYMVLGHAITDARDIAFPMLGLLDLETSFSKRKLHLGYRDLTPIAGPFDAPLKGHEFHYATTLHAKGQPMFAACDAEGTELLPMGLVSGSVSGSFAHIIDIA